MRPASRFPSARLRSVPRLALGMVGVLLVALVARLPARADEATRLVPAALVDLPAAPGGATATAVLAGGCFWGVQGVFEHVKGVRRVLAGYAGGNAQTASYETVSTGRTGHAESVEITYNPAEISYGRILQIFFSVAHDPTELNRQGPDAGTQYRSAIFVKDDAERRVAESYIAQLDQAHVYARPIATRVERLAGFYPAESYHQDYLTRHPNQPYIVFNDLPKVRSLQRLFTDRYREAPVLTTATVVVAN